MLPTLTSISEASEPPRAVRLDRFAGVLGTGRGIAAAETDLPRGYERRGKHAVEYVAGGLLIEHDPDTDRIVLREFGTLDLLDWLDADEPDTASEHGACSYRTYRAMFD